MKSALRAHTLIDGMMHAARKNACPPMLKRNVRSFDGQPLFVYHSEPRPQLADLILVLPFGVRHHIAARLYLVLAERFNVITWESRFVLHPEAYPVGRGISADAHAGDLIHVIEQCRDWRSGVDNGVSLVGYCSGAGVAMLGAVSHPQRIRRLALVCGEYMLPATQCNQTSFQREVDMLLPAAASSREMADSLFEKISASPRAPTSDFHNFITEPFSSAEHLHRFGLNYVAYRKVDFTQLAGEVRHPVMVMATRGDQQVGLESARIISRRLPGMPDVITTEGDHYELCRGSREMTHRLSNFFLSH